MRVMKNHYEIRFFEVMEELDRTKKELETVTRRWNRARRAYLKARAELERAKDAGREEAAVIAENHIEWSDLYRSLLPDSIAVAIRARIGET